MPSVTIGKTPIAWRLLRYTVKPKPGSTKKERVLHAAGLHCRPETSAGEFAALRRRHGKQGAVRKSPASYELPDDGEEATHVRDIRPGGRKYWREARDGEKATHVKYEGGCVRQNEAVHFIIGFGPDEVNPQDPEQVAHAFEYTVAHFRETMPGLQVHLVGQADGKGMTPDPTTGEVGGKFHVHAVANAVVYEDMEVSGRVWHAGSKMSGALTDIDSVRERHDAFMRENSDWGFTQKAKSVSEQKKEKRSVMDRRMRSRGERSNHDMIRDVVWSALHDPRSVDDAFRSTMGDPRTVDRSAFEAVMTEHGAEHGLSVEDPGWRRGKPPKQRKISYKLDGMPTNVRGEKLGEQYEADFISQQLRAIAAGKQIEARVESAVVGPARPVTVTTDDELTEARTAIADLVREEELDAWVEDWARAEDVSVKELLDQRRLLIDDSDDREQLRHSMHEWKKAQKERAQAAQKPTKPELAGDQRTEATNFDRKGASEASSLRHARHISMIPDISADVDRQLHESGAESAGEALLREFQEVSRHSKATPAAPEEVESDAHAAQSQARPRNHVNKQTVDSAPDPDGKDFDAATESTSFAPEAVVMAASVAPASSTSVNEYRSPLRDAVSKNRARQAFYASVALFDESARRVLTRGERIDESTVPKGIGAQFLEAFGGQLDDAVAEQLRLRQVKKAKVSAAFEEKKKAQMEIANIRTRAEKRGDPPGKWMYTEKMGDLIRERDIAARRVKRLREQISDGVYEVVTAKPVAVVDNDEQVEPQREQEGPGLC